MEKREDKLLKEKRAQSREVSEGNGAPCLLVVDTFVQYYFTHTHTYTAHTRVHSRLVEVFVLYSGKFSLVHIFV